jgi:Ser/Thr protein kinase RdoA (MazF antagonist)
MPDSVLFQYGFRENEYTIEPFGSGLINSTWKITRGKDAYLLQKINSVIFRQPLEIMENLSLLTRYFSIHHPDYLFVAPLNTTDGKNYVLTENKDCYRLFPFVNGSYSCNMVSMPSLAFEASRQFGKFTRMLSAFDPHQLHSTLPDFHDLGYRFRQFKNAVQHGIKSRITQSAGAIGFLMGQKEIVSVFEEIKVNQFLKCRVVHHDAKISNVLFDMKTHKGLCVIDLDTVMPGYYISDVGDMMRTYLSPVSEEESDLRRIEIREDCFLAIVKGYLEEMMYSLDESEIAYFVYAGRFAIYMQALRFLTDHLLGDPYYLVNYKDQNLVRSENQIQLLKKYTEKEDRLKDILVRVLEENPN